jgi:putative ubiquitin-RnfH superfamily antitoxin RatB of RatAB toxin-antitoxin module
MDFSNAESQPAMQEMDLTEEDISNSGLIRLNAAKFRSTTQITIFVENNQEDSELTEVSRLEIFGQLKNKR